MIAQTFSYSWVRIAHFMLCSLTMLVSSWTSVTLASVRITSTFAQNYANLCVMVTVSGLEERPALGMESFFHPIVVRVRSLRAFISASLRKILGMEAHDGDFASQRVCPFCGLITPRYETCCLECGKALKPA